MSHQPALIFPQSLASIVSSYSCPTIPSVVACQALKGFANRAYLLQAPGKAHWEGYFERWPSLAPFLIYFGYKISQDK